MKSKQSFTVLLFLFAGLQLQYGCAQSARNITNTVTAELSDYTAMFPLFDYVTITVDPKNWPLIFVSKNYRLPMNFVPPALSILKGSTGSQMDSRVVPHYNTMYDAAKAAGITLIPAINSYRTIEEQRLDFNRRVQRFIDEEEMTPEAAVRRLANGMAFPGASEHNLGLAVDFLIEGETMVGQGFAETPAFAWLMENAANFGFILRYPKNRTLVTSYDYEPWHWRYVGVETAKEIKARRITLEEYVGKPFMPTGVASEMRGLGLSVENFLNNQLQLQRQLPRQVEPNLMRWVDSIGLVAPAIKTTFNNRYLIENLDYGMTIGIERTRGGRIWACWVGGGDDVDAFFVFAWSDDEGETWSNTKMVIDPRDPNDPLKRRIIVGALWTDPKGRLFLFFDHCASYFDGRAGNWFMVSENPDDENPVWSEPQYIGFGVSLQKPMAASTGEYVLPVSLWVRTRINIPKMLVKEGDFGVHPLVHAFPELDSLRAAHVFVSSDHGNTWERRGRVHFPEPSFDEHIVIERKDGTWWMTARTALGGIHESFSTDRGFTWTEPQLYQPHVNARHFMMRLASGNLLLVRHGMPDTRLSSRSHLRAFISEDDGKTWRGNLLLDERRGISYPDGFQAPDGYIYISYDHLRDREGDIMMARFREEDILAREIVSPRGRLKMQISKPGRVKESVYNIRRRQQE